MLRLFMKKSFFGGVHPPERKNMSLHDARPLRISPPMVALSMRQHIGPACIPLVEPGQRVLLGQRIGDGGGLCMPVHAPVSGMVRAVRPVPHPGGGREIAVLVENDFRYEAAPLRANDAPLEQLSRETILHSIADAGVVGMGGAAFPTSVKAAGAMDKIDTLILNACECEPYITADDALLRIHPEQVLEGIRILQRLLRPERTLLAVEDNKPRAVAALRALIADRQDIAVAVLPARYPQGAEKQLIQSLTRRQLPPGSLPAELGCAVFNVSTCAAVCRALRLGMPLTERIVTVSGEAVAMPRNLIVPLGTSFADLIDAACGLTCDNVRILAGGPMMGTAQTDLGVPTVKATNAVLCLPESACTPRHSGACLRCGSCIDVCPMRLQPLYIRAAVQRQDLAQLASLRLADCILCGCCAYACPACIPLTDSFRRGKAMLNRSPQPKEARQ